MRLVAPLLLTVILASGVMALSGPEQPLAPTVLWSKFSPCLPKVLVAPEQLTQNPDDLVFQIHQDIERAQAVAVGRSAEDLWLRLTALIRAESCLRAVPRPPSGLSNVLADLRHMLLQEQNRLVRETRLAIVRADQTGDVEGSRHHRHALLKLIPLDSHPWHGRLQRELGEW